MRCRRFPSGRLSVVAILAVIALVFAGARAFGEPASPDLPESLPRAGSADARAGPPQARIAPRSGPLRSAVESDRAVEDGVGLAPGLRDGGFEEDVPDTPWAGDSLSFGTPRCTVEECGTGPTADGSSTAGPRSGEGWAWFGGFPGRESSWLEQTVILPPTACDRDSMPRVLELWLWHGARGGSDDTLRIEVEGQGFYWAKGHARTAGYRRLSLDLGSLACTSALTIRIECETYGPGVSNFSIDDLSIRPARTAETLEEIPTLGSAGFMLLVVLLALSAVRRL